MSHRTNSQTQREASTPAGRHRTGAFPYLGQILMNLWGLSGAYYENMKLLGAVVIGGSHLLVSFFSRNPGGHSQGRWGRTWRKSSPSGAVWVAGAQCPGSLIEQKASSTEEGFQVRALD